MKTVIIKEDTERKHEHVHHSMGVETSLDDRKMAFTQAIGYGVTRCETWSLQAGVTVCDKQDCCLFMFDLPKIGKRNFVFTVPETSEFADQLELYFRMFKKVNPDFGEDEVATDVIKTLRDAADHAAEEIAGDPMMQQLKEIGDTVGNA